MEKFFHLKEHGTDVKTEVVAGLTTFMAMAYILMVNANMFSNPTGDGAILGVSYGAIYIATALSAVIGTVLVGLMANLPLAMASGMGLNAFFVYTVCLGLGLTYANALVFVLLDGVIFTVLSVTGLLSKIFDAIPAPVRIAIPAGIGLYIAFIGLQDAGIIIANDATKVTLASFNIFSGTATWASIMPMLVTFFGLLTIAILSKRGVRGSVVWGILGSTIAYYILGFTIPGFYDGFFANMSFNPFTAFSAFGAEAVGKVFTEGFDFSAYIAAHGVGNFIITLITTSLAFCMVDMFDTLGTLYGACARGDMLTKDGNVPNMNKAMLSDAIATCTGAALGTSTVTTFLESAAGVGEGGRTGLTSMVTGGLFFIAMFFSPVAQLIPTYATAAALIYVGVLMMNCVRDVDWTKSEDAVPAFLTVALMSFAYNISYGIGIGVISYTVIAIFTRRAKEIRPMTWVIGILFTLMFFLTH
ncbi:MAG: NCS2 family permease [Oscillibacter sp.]|jgi:AGZA family xanthine/uracil permease-like MFS transporter|nr:NCS2 family permease [Oscillibacter sp.]